MSRSYYAYPPAVHAATHNYIGMSLANAPVLVISRPMPQQPMPAPRRQGHSRRPGPAKSPDRRKRYGMVFDTNPLRGMSDADDDDDDSTWSMSRSRTSRRMRSSGQTSVRTRNRNSSPAQEIVARYRASQSGDELGGASSSSASYLHVPRGDGYFAGTRSRTNSDGTELRSASGPRLRYRYSRAHAMDRATGEAYLMAVQAGGYHNIPCQRPGCRRILPTIRDLASHLAMHDIDPQERFVPPGPRYSSFIDMGHSVDGRPHRRYIPSPAPYACSKLRKYLSKFTYPCRPCYDDYDSDEDFF